MNIEALKEKVSKAQEKVDKIEKTIEKYRVQKEKKVIILNKLLEENGYTERYDDFKDDSNYRHRYYGKPIHNDFYWSCCDIDSKIEAIDSNNKKLEEAKETLKVWKERLGAEEARIQYIQDSVPDIIKKFLENWKNEVIKYYIKEVTDDESYKNVNIASNN